MDVLKVTVVKVFGEGEMWKGGTGSRIKLL